MYIKLQLERVFTVPSEWDTQISEAAIKFLVFNILSWWMIHWTIEADIPQFPSLEGSRDKKCLEFQAFEIMILRYVSLDKQEDKWFIGNYRKYKPFHGKEVRGY